MFIVLVSLLFLLLGVVALLVVEGGRVESIAVIMDCVIDLSEALKSPSSHK